MRLQEVSGATDSCRTSINGAHRLFAGTRRDWVAILRRLSRRRSRGTVRSVFIIEWQLPSMSRINSQVKTVYTPGQPCRSAVETGRRFAAPCAMLWCILVLALPRNAHGKFRPYANNGGSLAAACGHGFALIAADSQFLHGMMITSSVFDRVVPLSDVVLMGTSGCAADCESMTHDVRTEAERYIVGAKLSMDVSVAAQLCSGAMYARRGFPHHMSLVVCGLDSVGFGRVFVFDSIGSLMEGPTVTAGSAREVLQSVLDGLTPWHCSSCGKRVPNFQCADDAREVLLAAFRVAARRDATVGRLVDLTLVRQTEAPLRETVLVDGLAKSTKFLAG